MEFAASLSEEGRLKRDKQRTKLLKELTALRELKNREIVDTRSWIEKRLEESVRGWTQKLESHSQRREEALERERQRLTIQMNRELEAVIERAAERINKEYDKLEETAHRHLETSSQKLEIERAKPHPQDAMVAAQERKMRVLLEEYERLGFLSPEDRFKFQEVLQSTQPPLTQPEAPAPSTPFNIDTWLAPGERELAKMREEALAEHRRQVKEREEQEEKRREEALRQYEMARREQERQDDRRQREQREQELKERQESSRRSTVSSSSTESSVCSEDIREAKRRSESVWKAPPPVTQRPELPVPTSKKPKKQIVLRTQKEVAAGIRTYKPTEEE
jgi:hypothetical protein